MDVTPLPMGVEAFSDAMTAWSEAESSMLRASPTRLRLRPRTVEELSFYMRNTLNKEKPKDKFEDVEKEGSRLQCRNLHGLLCIPWAS